MLDFILSNSAIIALFLRLFSLFISLIFIIPLMVKQAQVKNGLRVFRWLLMGYGILINVSNLLTSYFLFDVISSSVVQKELNSYLQIINAIIFLLASLLGYAMYHYQFTEENVKFHAKIERKMKQEEKEQAKKAKKR